MPTTSTSSTQTRYDVDPHLVAEAIVRRLLAGRAFVAASALEPA